MRNLLHLLLIGALLGCSTFLSAQTTVTFTEYPIPTAPNSPQGITTGPDGALWFTEYYGKIGRITTAGVVTEYPVPTAGSQPNGIASGPDGALWFTENGGEQDRADHHRRGRHGVPGANGR